MQQHAARASLGVGVMISGFAQSIAAFVRPQISMAQVERAVAQNGVGNLAARDTLASGKQRERASKVVGNKLATVKLDIRQQMVGSKKKA